MAPPRYSTHGHSRITARLGAGAAALVASLVSAVAAGTAMAKDIGPADPRCDIHDKSGTAWRACADAAATTDSERFYAGYWLAKTGHYRSALDQLEAVAAPDARTSTYIGFAYRKLGALDTALVHYGAALRTDPGFTVARAYLGEAYLTMGDRAAATAELGEIAARCGVNCAEYADLAGHIADFDRRNGRSGPG